MIPEGIGRHQARVRAVLQPIVRRLWDLDISGLDNVPSTGPAILCPNHAAAIDSLFVPSCLNRNLIYVGKAEYLDDWKTRWLFPALGMIPIDRRGGAHAEAALDAARGVLGRGELFGIYPEGTRSRSGRLHKGHTGAARLSIETGAPIIPVGLLGTAEVQTIDRAMPQFNRTVTVRFGEPVGPDRYRGRLGDPLVYRQMIDEVMFEIQKLTGLDYDPTYAGSAKAAAAAASKRAEGSAVDTARPVEEPALTPASDPGEGLLHDAAIPRRSSRDVLAATASRDLADLLA